MAQLEKTMFREYDLRGRVNDKELNESSVEIIAKAYGTMLRKRNIFTAVLGHDFRECSERLKEAFIKGLTSTGVNVIDLGMVLTPMMYSAQYHFKTEGGVIITSSHNPNGWSGFKLSLGYSHTLVPEEMEELRKLTISENFSAGKGNVQKESFYEIYANDILKRVKIMKPLKIVINTGNGTAGPIVPDILRKAGCEVIEMMTNLDWTFPKYFPNPTLVEMIEDTGNKVREVGADIGIALDGDGDRLGITDEEGNVIWPDRYLILLSRNILEKYPNSRIIFDVKCSQALAEDIISHGGVPIMWITGHSYIMAKRKAENALLAGEMSGHMFFGEPEYYGFDDAVFAALKILEYLSSQNRPLSEIISTTPYYVSSPNLHVDCPDEKKYEIVNKLTEEFKREYEVIDINGARVLFDDGWGLVRASSNLPVLDLRFEAKTEERLNEIKDIFKERLSSYPEIGKDWYSG